MNALMNCLDCEAQLGDYRDGTLTPELAAAVRAHVGGCAACGAMLADLNAVSGALSALPRVEPPARLVAAILARTSAVPARLVARPPWWSWAGLRQAMATPRLALGVAMSVFAVAMMINAAQLDLNHVSAADWAPSSLAGAVQRQVSRVWARGVSYYNALRVV
jgi:anti-sigma factor RsiW